MKALVTGGAGFIGSHLVDRLLREGYDVRILDNLEPRVHPRGKPSWVPGEAEFVRGDVRDLEVMRRALDGIQVVFHEAAYQDYMPDFSKFFHVNSVSTAAILELILERTRSGAGIGAGVEKVVVASSQAVYGEGQYCCRNLDCPRHGQPTAAPGRSEEQLRRGVWDLICAACGRPMTNLPLHEAYHNPRNAYAISKLAQELAAVHLGQLHGIPTVALRYSIVQGPRQSLYNQYSGVCRIFCMRLLNDQPPIIYEDGLQKRDYTHIKDVVEANMTVLKEVRADYRVFNVGSGREITVRDYAVKLAEKMGKAITPMIPGSYRVGDNRHSVSDVSRLRELGWQPAFGLDRIFDDYLSWLDTQGNPATYLQQAEAAMRAQGVIRQVENSQG